MGIQNSKFEFGGAAEAAIICHWAVWMCLYGLCRPMSMTVILWLLFGCALLVVIGLCGCGTAVCSGECSEDVIVAPPKPAVAQNIKSSSVQRRSRKTPGFSHRTGCGCGTEHQISPHFLRNDNREVEVITESK